ncbi:MULTISPECIES: flagellar assembly protein FliH [Photobacterium]|uniref:flagellar assembly protein FliH n=1 Tax=Photobacterium TaxID=657 RepID=UPI002E182067|nr:MULTISPECIES: flagellar assembly protein FliH [Photobacterium]MEC6795955.1 flagellar assembly protein FliH [Photobacterium sp. S4TG1]MEC6906155.1 flagellar assembly protein FliH [Photobacterium piscicola]
MSDERRRGFMRVSEHQAQELERWAYPDYSHDSDHEPENALNYDHQYYLEQQQLQQQQLTQPEPAPPPLTAAELEAMQQSAYDEGVEQGRQAGHSEGFSQGHAEGVTAGHAEGLAQGLQQGLEQAQAQIDQQVALLTAVMDKFADPIAKVDTEVEQQLLLLVNGLTKALIRVEVKTNPQVLLNTLREVVATLPIAERAIKMHLHPDDVALVHASFDEADLQQRQWSLIAEPSLQRGDLQLECGSSSVDYLIDDRILHSLTTFNELNSHLQEPVL